ncbi:hypothetical protein C7S18_19275 [Ahniella affigens]|uniref:Cytochrome c domain-containing protein n=2 Tax=Ahniella affigens TaxID=2021234 RepID=A0A2P1PWG1_9GAMM|nr:hypothetical protein C7S18_19275 [Ahniella affigens]
MVAELVVACPRALGRTWLAAAWLLATAACGADGQTGDAIARGRSLYLSGTHADGRVLSAQNESTGLAVPPAFVACVNCHGHEGRGGNEAGTVASDIRWETLTKPYDYRRPDGRLRAPYDAAAFYTALTQGRDPSGYSLDSAMPRFALEPREADDLWAALQSLAKSDDQGVSEDVIRIGVMMTPHAALNAAAAMDRQLLNCWFGALSARGGMFRRRIELVDAAGAPQQFAPLPLAVLTISSGAGDASTAAAPPTVPMISATEDFSGTDHRYRFAVYPGVVGRARMLARYALARTHPASPALGLVYPDDADDRAAATAIAANLQPLAQVMSLAVSETNANAVVARMRDAGLTHVIVLGAGGSIDAVMTSAERQQWAPQFLWIERPDRDSDDARAVTIEPALGHDVSVDAGSSYAACVDLPSLRLRDRTRQLALLAAAQMLVTGLEQAGREISRERLVETLQSLREFHSGFAPPGSLSPERHVAASGLYVLPLALSPSAAEPVWMLIE